MTLDVTSDSSIEGEPVRSTVLGGMIPLWIPLPGLSTLSGVAWSSEAPPSRLDREIWKVPYIVNTYVAKQKFKSF